MPARWRGSRRRLSHRRRSRWRRLILADTSAWVDYDRATGSSSDRRLAELIATDCALTVTELVLMEVLASARSDAPEGDLRRVPLRFALLRCMIAAVAYDRDAVLLSWDVDMDRVARVIGIDLDGPSLRA